MKFAWSACNPAWRTLLRQPFGGFLHLFIEMKKMSKYKLAVGNKVRVPMIFEIQDGEKIKRFNFSLTCERLTVDEFQASNKNSDGITTNEKIQETMIRITEGWVNQTFVLDEAGQPAPCDQEAKEILFQAPNVLDIAVASYMKESAAKAKN